MSQLPISDFIQALVKAKLKFPEIRKSRIANGKTFSYKYADISDILEAVYKPLAEEGIILNFKAVPDEKTGGETMNAVLTHVSGNSFSSSGSIPKCHDAQELGSWKTYMRRYLACEVLGIQAEDDDDGAATKKNHDGNRGSVTGGGTSGTRYAHPPVTGKITIGPKSNQENGAQPNAPEGSGGEQSETCAPPNPSKISIGKKAINPDEYFTTALGKGKRISECDIGFLEEWTTTARAHFLKTYEDPLTSRTGIARSYRAAIARMAELQPQFESFSGSSNGVHQ